MVQGLSEFSLAGVVPDGVKRERVNLPGSKKALGIRSLEPRPEGGESRLCEYGGRGNNRC